MCETIRDRYDGGTSKRAEYRDRNYRFIANRKASEAAPPCPGPTEKETTP